MDVRERLKLLGINAQDQLKHGPALPMPAPNPLPAPEVPHPFTTPGFYTPTPNPYPQPAFPSAGAKVQRRPIERVVRGEEISTPHGDCFVVPTSYQLDKPHGQTILRAATDHNPATTLPLLAKDAGYAEFDLRRAAFIDTETTGLAGGTGTYAFLVGIGYLQGDQFEVRQFFMRDPSNEKAMLVAINNLCAELGLTTLVSFNGKCYDMPLLETRYTLSRMRFAMSEPLHLDLLAPSRRLWKGRLESCSLHSLEGAIIGLQRTTADVPGWLIPSLYFDYLHTGDAVPLRRVFYHNQQDIVSMLALLHHLCAAVSTPDCLSHPSDLLGVARCFEEAGNYEQAIATYALAAAKANTSLHAAQVAERLSYLHKRLGSQQEAHAIWQKLVEQDTPLLFPYLELAKHHEHKLRDYATAMRLTNSAREQARRQLKKKELLELNKRLERLEKKLAKIV